ncbi:MAG: methylmalonyl Co-A mutase-associated GTPase MeaB, partial [Deltaproteobacteria bacterium]|nr:methylmalonyl Co-A mutase-associated GTPase MeaB [Deltaproteobacteria bacterium]
MMGTTKKYNGMLEELLAGNRRVAARLITMIENRSEGIVDLMKRIYPHTGHALIIGLTGAGGSGKSSLVGQLIGSFREQGKKVGVIAVDPSSPFSGGAILGDRIRFQKYAQDKNVYIRSMGSRGYLGGLCRATTDAIRILEAMGNDVILVETLGAGQDEIDIIHIVQTCLLVVTPGMGDDIQAMKAGIMEIADIIVLNKADLEGATVALQNLAASLNLKLSNDKEAWRPKIIPCVSAASKSEDISGIESLVEAIAEHQNHLKDTERIELVRYKRVEQ